MPETITTTMPEVSEETSFRLMPPYHVIILNDDDHSMEFVVDVLMKALPCKLEDAVQHMMEAHKSGRAVIWTGSKEVAEFKQDQVQTFHETKNGKKIGPVGCVIEPAPE